MSIAIIAGIDEAGRGALAGPVIASACVFDPKKRREIPRIADSKMLTAAEREEAFLYLTKKAQFGVGMSAASVVDKKGILAATEIAMQNAVSDLIKKQKPTYLLVDGRDAFWFDIPHSSIIRGDQSEPCIAAASIIAKVTRDRLMIEWDDMHPEYGFAQHKGYGTKKHREMIQRIGPCPLHRRSFLQYCTHTQTPSGAFSG